MAFGGFALENVVRAAIRADDFAGMQDVEVNARMLIPERGVRLRAVQRQIMGGDFDGGFVCHGGYPVSIGVGGKRGGKVGGKPVWGRKIMGNSSRFRRLDGVKIGALS